jgi:hypothetical protein
MQLRNAILIALAIDATPQEIEHAHDTIDRIFGADGKGNGVAPEYLVNTSVPATNTDGKTANGLQTAQATTITAAPVDKTGLPYDERIHSSSVDNRLNADGTWRAKRGVDKTFAKQIEAELRATLSAPVVTTSPAGPAPTPTPAATQSPPMPGGNLPPMPGAAAIDPAYSALVAFIGANTQSTANPNAKFTDQYITDVLKHYGIADGSLPNLAHRLDLVPTVDGWLRSVLAQ